MFKRKRKEKAKRGSRTIQLIILAVVLLLMLSGALTYLVLIPDTDTTIAAEPAIAFQGDCSYTQGYGSRENVEIGQSLLASLQTAELNVTGVTVADDLHEYRNCGDTIEPLYQTCTSLTIETSINENDPSEGNLGREIASIMDVLTTQNSCTPETLNIVFETPGAGSITWQMNYKQALEAYYGGARGIELYDPSARR